MQKCAGNFNLARLTSRQVAYLIVSSVQQMEPGQHVIRPGPGGLLVDPVQGRVIHQVLRDGEINVESARLEYNADHTQCFTRLARDVMAENPDPAMLNCVETRGEREQGALSCAVESEENEECGRWNRERNVDKRLTHSVPMAHALDSQRRRLHCFHFRAQILASGLIGYSVRPNQKAGPVNVARLQRPKATRQPESS